VPLLSLKLCGYERVQKADFAVQPRPHAEFGSLQVTVTEQAKHVAEECDPAIHMRAGATTWRATFSWDPTQRTFVTNSDALDALSKHNDLEVQ
jgi:hypothetical protein